MPSRDELTLHYRQLPDARIAQLAVHESEGLTPEALDVLRNEVRVRGLADELQRAIEIRTRIHDPHTVQDILERFRRLPCPICEVHLGLLNAATVARAKSFLLFTSFSTDVVVGCVTCIRAAATEANGVTLGLAWWGLPWGPIEGIRALRINAKAVRTAEGIDASPELTTFIRTHPELVQVLFDQFEAGRGGDPGP